MIERHFNEDKKLNSYWTIIRVNMSIGDNDYTNSIVDYSNLVGCLPLILNNKVILKDENQTQQTGVSTIVAKKKQAMKNAGSSGIPLYNEVEVHLPKLNINSLVNKTRACNEKFTTITDEPTFEHKEYTLKYNLKKCIVADLSCELVHSVLVYKCSVLKCQYNQFSTVVINELFKHINLNHQNIVWDRKCDMCKQKVDNLNEQYLLKDALEHIISHHLVLKKIHQPKIIFVKNKQAMKNAGSSGIHLCNEVEVHLPKLNINSLINKIRACNEKCTAITDDPTFEHKEYTLKYNLKKCIVAGLSCELMHSILVYKCSVSKCEYNPFSTVVLNDLFKHIYLNHKHMAWDKKCDMCKQKVDNLNEQYLLKDALEHIISHHLVLKKNHQHKIILNFPSGMSSLSENLTERTQIKQSNYAITKSKNSANIVENTQSSPAIVIQIPANEKMMERSNSLELVNYNQINILDDDQNHLKKNVRNIVSKGVKVTLKVKQNSNKNPINDNTKKMYKPPPITIKGVKQFDKLKQLLTCEEPVGNEQQFKVLSNNETRILTTSESQFRSTIKILEENKVKYHRYQLKSEKPFRVVLRGINHDSDMGIITNELYYQGHEVSKLTNIQIKKISDPKNKNSEWTYIRLPLFFVDLKPLENNKDIYNKELLCHQVLKIESPLKNKEVSQCKNCQALEHTHNYCHKSVVCVKCSEGHRTEGCPKSKKAKAKCANCGENHTANWKGCSAYKKAIERAHPKQVSAVQRIQ
ncbi:Pre-C2HC domain [Cinara cedri]|uniref:Pre-C2HC domain n=1 Tax=Cinara cedri TaxID=506608 RepID=A0A5E4NT07_9HEMI|nr:Pre-C2HC domain [Cinara cedri]